jgi:hypothetical protein
VTVIFRDISWTCCKTSTKRSASTKERTTNNSSSTTASRSTTECADWESATASSTPSASSKPGRTPLIQTIVTRKSPLSVIPKVSLFDRISENLREIVYCTAISVGGQAEWDFAWERYLNANVENEKETLMMALGCSKEIWILSRYLEWAVTERSGIRKHDSARVFAAVANNAIGQQLAYRFLKTNWNRLRT